MLYNKIALAGLIAASITVPAYADALGATVGVQAWKSTASGGFANTSELVGFAFDEETTTSLYVKFEHPLPLIPNVRLRNGTLKAAGNTRLTKEFKFEGKTYAVNADVTTNLDFTNTDFTFYWELLDNDLVGLDFGVTAKYLSGEFDVSDGTNASSEDASLWIPMAYVGAKVAVPLTGVFAYGDINMVSYDDNSVHDYEVGVGYSFVDNFAIDVSVTAGYREVSIEINDVDDLFANIQFDGYFVGLEAHF